MNEPRDRPNVFQLNFRLLRVGRPEDYIPRPGIPYRTQLWYIVHFLDQLYKAVTPMPKQQAAARNTFTAITFVNLRLDDNQKKTFAGWMKEKGETLVDEIAIAMSEHGKMSISWDDTNKCFISAITCKDDKSPNCDHCVSSRSQDWYEALALTCFKVLVLLKDKPWSEGGTAANWG